MLRCWRFLAFRRQPNRRKPLRKWQPDFAGESWIRAICQRAGIHLSKVAGAFCHLIAAVKAHPRYDFVFANGNNEVSIEFFEDKESIGLSNFTMASTSRRKQNTGSFQKHVICSCYEQWCQMVCRMYSTETPSIRQRIRRTVDGKAMCRLNSS